MRYRILIIAALAFCVAAAAWAGYFIITRDVTGPEIRFDDSAAVNYETGMDKARLLEGVTASDEKDGDVTESLMIESIKVRESKKEAEITYVATDRRNNVTKVKRKIACEGAALESSGNVQPGQTEVEENQQGEAFTPTQEPENNGGQQAAGLGDAPTTTPEATQEVTPQPTAEPDANQATEAAIAALPAANPKFRLKEHQITLTKGTAFKSLNYVKEIVDDKDSKEKLYGNIQVSGAVDTNTAGNYRVSYYVVDSDGNKSNVEVLEVIIG